MIYCVKGLAIIIENTTYTLTFIYHYIDIELIQ